MLTAIRVVQQETPWEWDLNRLMQDRPAGALYLWEDPARLKLVISTSLGGLMYHHQQHTRPGLVWQTEFLNCWFRTASVGAYIAGCGELYGQKLSGSGKAGGKTYGISHISLRPALGMTAWGQHNTDQAREELMDPALLAPIITSLLAEVPGPVLRVVSRQLREATDQALEGHRADLHPEEVELHKYRRPDNLRYTEQQQYSSRDLLGLHHQQIRDMAASINLKTEPAQGPDGTLACTYAVLDTIENLSIPEQCLAPADAYADQANNKAAREYRISVITARGTAGPWQRLVERLVRLLLASSDLRPLRDWYKDRGRSRAVISYLRGYAADSHQRMTTHIPHEGDVAAHGQGGLQPIIYLQAQGQVTRQESMNREFHYGWDISYLNPREALGARQSDRDTRASIALGTIGLVGAMVAEQAGIDRTSGHQISGEMPGFDGKQRYGLIHVAKLFTHCLEQQWLNEQVLHLPKARQARFLKTGLRSSGAADQLRQTWQRYADLGGHILRRGRH
jgi:hypothetical protein